MRNGFGSVFTPLWQQMRQFQDEMNRVFDRWGNPRPADSAGGYPALNVWEEGDNLWLEAELPGLDLKDLEIYVTGGNQLTLKGERKAPTVEKGVWHRQERSAGSFVRTVTLPFPVDADKVEAKFENGVLRVQLAKHESAKPRKIPVKGE
jgi:HSP20 family protein